MDKAMKAELARLPTDLQADIKKSTRKARKQERLAKWRGRAASVGQDWDQKSKQERRVFKVAWRADRALQKLSTIIAARDAKGGATLAKAAGSAGRVVDHHEMSERELVEANLSRRRDSL
jgi:hypothetical protein